MKALNLFNKAFLFGALLFAAACADDIEGDCLPESPKEGITIQAICNDMLPQVLMTRADMTNTPKTAKEKQINTLHLFFFDENGNFLTPTNPDIFKPYYRLEVNDPAGNGDKQAALTISKNTFDGQSDLKNVQVYAVANVYGHDFWTDWTPLTENREGKIVYGDKNNATTEVKITKLDDLKNWYYRPTPREDISQLPAPGMPMVGLTDKVDLSQESATIQINMQALMARVDVAVQLDANQTNNDGSLPKLQIREYGVRNMPYSVPFTALNPGEMTIIPEVEGIDKDPNAYIRREATVPYDGAVLFDGQKAATFTYYTYENVQKPTGTPNYPNGVDRTDETVIQRWKRTIANKNASALVLKGDYVTHQGLEYTAEFNVYMGNNTYDNFEVRRNCCYKNNITIRGLDYVRNSDPNVYNFDGRVNVVTDNPLYLAIVNERKVDAHASAVPMDVWLLLRESGTAGGDRPSVKHKTTVTVSIANPESTPWIRMEKIPRRTMEAKNFAAGTGARDYFTTDLVTRELKDNTTITIDGDTDDSRTRVYFYIDENVPQSANAEVPDRKALINVRYENSLGDVRERVLEIEQRGMLRVSQAHTQAGTTVDNTYIEFYEEYLSHNDPLDQHLQPGEYYTGLPWGKMGSNYTNVTGTGTFLGTPTGTLTVTEIYDNGYLMTQRIIGNVLNYNYIGSISNVHLYMEEAPESAFHYCYGKNKRNADGTVPASGTNGHWYMPGIRELERALVQYYLTFPDFQNNYYWSAASGKNTRNATEGRAGENTDYGRATKVLLQGNSISYAPSGDGTNCNYPAGGRTPRDMTLRIRAFYKYGQ